MQVLEQQRIETSRSRTPSPPCSLEEVPLQPPNLRFAPPYIGTAAADVVRRRRRPKGRGSAAWDLCANDHTSGSSQDWESGSQTLEWETNSSASSQRNRRSGTSFVATNLSYLESKDSACVIAVKKITRLGFDAAESLRLHFEQWGPVEEVLLSNVPVHGEPLEHVSGMRRRHPGMGWVVMKNPDDAKNALSRGELQVVQAAQIRAAPFVKKVPNESSEAIAEESAEEDERHDVVDAESPKKGSLM